MMKEGVQTHYRPLEVPAGGGAEMHRCKQPMHSGEPDRGPGLHPCFQVLEKETRPEDYIEGGLEETDHTLLMLERTSGAVLANALGNRLATFGAVAAGGQPFQRVATSLAQQVGFLWHNAGDRRHDPMLHSELQGGLVQCASWVSQIWVPSEFDLKHRLVGFAQRSIH